ncbi:WD repeat-containing protein 7 [Halotydeus destructor]|nr:WD repeat-containing protein 7 [Halotydeus destructor]
MTVGLSSQLIVPITLWGSEPPTHCISTIFLANDEKTIVTGCNDGHICVWEMDKVATGHWTPTSIVPRTMLFGHSSPILCLADGHHSPDIPLLVSSSETGEMCLWDMNDGRCLESVKLQYIHTSMQTYLMTEQDTTRIFCNGYYSEVLVIDVQTLEILFCLTSRVNPDWINALHVYRPASRQEDMVVALSITGIVKTWTLSGNETRSSEPIYETESKPIRCLNPLKLTCCAFSQRTVLIVCTKFWQVYDAGDFSLLCSVDSKPGERWSGGDFLSSDRVIVWSDFGKAYIYQLPSNKHKGNFVSCNPESKDFHAEASEKRQPFLYCILAIDSDERLLCPPVAAFRLLTRASNNPFAVQKIFIRGDATGKIAIWNVPDVTAQQLSSIIQESTSSPVTINADAFYSMKKAWDCMQPRPCGVVDQLVHENEAKVKITSSVYLPMQGRLVCGREDGSIIMISATQTVMLQLLLGKHQAHENWLQHQYFHGHAGRVNCLLYPHHVHERYNVAHLLSGGVDFSVCLWDIYTGSLLHRFSVHAGEIKQLLVPPKDCNPRVLQCVCSVGSDNSVALLSIKERKCVMLASRHLFPINVIKWKPFDDFMIVGCSDGSVYVWQMETGHLDRVVQGIVAEDILSACDENVTVTVGDRLSNPAMHLLRGLRSRNLSAIRQAAARGLHQLSGNQNQQHRDVVDPTIQSRSHPLMIQGLKANPKDQDSHVLFFDIESLIVNMLSDEYADMSPGALESTGLTLNSEYQKYSHMVCSPENQNKLSGLFAKVKENAENAAQKLQAKAEKAGFKPGEVALSLGRRLSGASSDGQSSPGVATPTRKPGKFQFGETSLTMETAHILLSLLHAWGVDSDLDQMCEFTLGLMKPLRPLNFGLLSKGGHMSLLLPPCITKIDPDYYNTELAPGPVKVGRHVRIVDALGPEFVLEEARAKRFAAKFHWELSTAVTTNHLLSIVSLANTLMSMSNASFIPENERRRKLHRKLSRANSRAAETDFADNKILELESINQQQQQVKQGWSLLAALHCVLLPDQLKSANFKKPLVEILARRWQDRCLEIREAAQALLLSELKRRGAKGRKQLVDEWAPYLPQYGDQVGNPASAPMTGGNLPHSQSQLTPASTTPSQFDSSVQLRQTEDDEQGPDDDQEDDESDDHASGSGQQATDGSSRRPSSTTAEGKRKQATAIILLGVIGAEYGHEMEQNKKRAGDTIAERKKSFVEGFGPGNYSLARHTSHALAYLLLAKPSRTLPLHTSLRRAAIDLIGRGFTVWEPYLDVSKILLGLLELCCESEKLVPSMSFGLPLMPAADSCRTAKHAISLIATARPAAFITTLKREVTRYNSIQQNPNAINVNMFHTVLVRAKPEILRNVELLIDKMASDVADLIIETMEIVLHCLDINHLKTKGLHEVFPALAKFANVSYCGASRRIAVGAKNGTIALYELRTPQKSQMMAGHAHAITCCSFSPDGKHLATYSSGENKMCFWSTATSLFGLGNAQTRCVRTYNTPPALSNGAADAGGRLASSNGLTGGGQRGSVRLVWVANKVVILMFADGTEYRYTV